ncbi:uncharacterized protein N7459_006668 [Penicillium hispanicum]|uniref:uncharacterized protein n=1 Tax=Penicillium hispanicum TaxID=1080232 RepID=UPI002541545F|nr:uncharacterized protein N7459_006668 [Penicillium hispanicum]KAJ5577704.1 hypothetical protein N7459_006668 [Penicillium hispanicum]
MLEVNFGPEVDPEKAKSLLRELDSLAESLPPKQAAKARKHADLIVMNVLDVPDDETKKWLPIVTRSVIRMKPEARETVEKILPWILKHIAFAASQAELVMTVCLRDANIHLMSDVVARSIPFRDQPVYFPSFEDVESRRRKYADEIFDNFQSLQKILQHHGGRIRNWWRKRRRADRRKLLVSAWPEINEEHHMDLRAVVKKEPTKVSINAFKWPYLNLEDLTETDLFIPFLHARAHHPPSQFADADKWSWNPGLMQNQITLPWLHRHTMMFTGRDSPDEYGRVLPWSGNPQAKEWGTSHLGMSVHEGLVTMEIQAHMYKFLLDCCLKMTQMTQESLKALPDPSEAQNVESGPSQANTPYQSSAGFDSTDTPLLHARYYVPRRFDIDCLVDVVEARLSSVRDHIISLREDPGYFASNVSDVKEHNKAQILDLQDKRNPHLDSDDFWGEVFHNLVRDAFHGLLYWDSLYTGLQDLRTLLKTHGPSEKPDEILPEDLHSKFLFVMERISQGSGIYLRSFSASISASPPLRGFFRLGENKEITKTPATKMTPNLAFIVSFVELFTKEEWMVHRLTMPALINEFETIFEKDPKLTASISPHLQRFFSDVALLISCHNQIRCYQPWAAAFDAELKEQRKKLVNEYISADGDFFSAIMKAVRSKSIIPFQRPLRKMEYPIHKRRTRDITLKLQQGERDLDAFWAHFDSLFVAGVNLKPALTNFYRARPAPSRTPDWVEAPMPAPKGEKRGFEEVEQRTEATVERDAKRQKKEKQKTRGVPDPSRASEEAEPEQEQEAPEETIYRVSKRALEAFETVFHQPSTTNKPGELSWKEFRHAMKSLGFEEQKLQGSAWHFTPPPSLQDKGSIHIHGPHPSDKHPFHVARAIGRRLRDQYGFEAQMFQLNR